MNNPIAIISILILLSSPFTLHAGQLDDFESSAKSEKKKRSKSSSSYGSSGSSEDESIGESIRNDISLAVAEAIVKGIGYTLMAGTFMSTAYTVRTFDKDAFPGKLTESDDTEEGEVISLEAGRELGSQFLPIARFDYSFGYLNRGVTLQDYDIELGAAFLSTNYKRSVFFEDSNGDRLAINQNFINYRLSYTKYVQITLGWGNYQIDGRNKTDSGAFKWGVGIYPEGNYGFEVDLVSTDYPLSVEDSEYSIHYDGNYWALRAGYRILETPVTSLNGFFTGFSLSF